MTGRLHMIINVSGFQLGWLCCVLMAANKLPLIGITVALLIVAVHFYLVQNRLQTFWILLSVTLLGGLWDSLLTSQQILVFDTGMITSHLAPGWIIAMWMLFATTLNVSLRWLYGRYWLALILGSISGPLAYQAGAAMGAVSIPDLTTANVILSIGWAMILSAMIFIAESLEMTKKRQAIINEY